MNRRFFPYSILVLVAIAASAGGCTTTDHSSPSAQSSQSAPSPTNAWLLAGDGKPAAGDLQLTFSGTYELTATAAAFDGASGFAATNGPGPVDTTTSFSVAAWVSLSPPRRVGGSEFAAALSQLGDEAAAFYLGIGEGRWSFGMKDADTNDPGHTTRASSGAASPEPTSWRQMVGSYDQAAQQIRLYLDGEPAAEASFKASWKAQGPLTVGRSQAHSKPSDFWPGAVTDVQTFSTALTGAEVRTLANGSKPAAPPPPLPAAKTLLTNGTYEYVFTAKEAEQLRSCCFSPQEAAAAGGFDQEVRSVIRIKDDQWQLYYKFSGKVFEVGGQPEGDGRTYTIKGDVLTTSNGSVDVTYRWSMRKGTLSLMLVGESAKAAEAPAVRLNTEHKYKLVSR